VVAAASYEARRFSAMRAAKKLSLFVSPRFEPARNFQKKFFLRMVRALSLDEAYLDVTKRRKMPAFWQKKLIAYFNEVGLTASAGISVNKFVKIASDYNDNKKKNPEDVVFFWKNYPFENFRLEK
jgi:DNA polymerase-4